MFGGNRVQARGQLGGAVGSEFVGVQLDLEAPGRGLAQVIFRIGVGKISVFAKNIDEVGQLLFLHLRQDIRAAGDRDNPCSFPGKLRGSHGRP